MGSPEDHRPPKRIRVGGFEEAAAYVMEKDMDALDCGVCFLPLKPPIFQCQVGHAVCEHCRDSFVVAVPGGSSSIKCHVCGVAGGYHRCHVINRVVGSVRVPCANAAYGCNAKLIYYDLAGHVQVCTHAPCHCPAGEACGFVGSTAALVDHFAGVHRWPCTRLVRPGPGKKRVRCRTSSIQLWVPISDAFCRVRLHDGFNFILIVHSTDQSATNTGNFLFLLKRGAAAGRTHYLRALDPPR
ncbi:hypothetical protein QOZ80_5AG0404630 [Eleusine coracana subsp. coracana]|nr:hypothetical protein QOZ80_5AG0404630 [Eleusine coracana subsp. coracana]